MEPETKMLEKFNGAAAGVEAIGPAKINSTLLAADSVAIAPDSVTLATPTTDHHANRVYQWYGQVLVHFAQLVLGTSEMILLRK